MSLTLNKKSLRLLLFLNHRPAPPADVAAYVYNRLDLAEEGGPSIESLIAGLGEDLVRAEHIFNHLSHRAWEIKETEQGWTISFEHRKLMAAVEALWRRGVYWTNRYPLTPRNVETWLTEHGRLEVA